MSEIKNSDIPIPIPNNTPLFSPFTPKTPPNRHSRFSRIVAFSLKTRTFQNAKVAFSLINHTPGRKTVAISQQNHHFHPPWNFPIPKRSKSQAAPNPSEDPPCSDAFSPPPLSSPPFSPPQLPHKPTA